MSIASIYRLQHSHPRFSGTKIELALREILDRHGIPYKHNFPLVAARANVDIFLEQQAIVVEADGCFFHRCPLHFPDNAYVPPRDPSRDARIEKAGYRVLHFWEHEIKNSIAAVEERILSAVGGCVDA